MEFGGGGEKMEQNKKRVYASFEIDMNTIDEKFAAVLDAKEKLATALDEFNRAVAVSESGVVLRSY